MPLVKRFTIRSFHSSAMYMLPCESKAAAKGYENAGLLVVNTDSWVPLAASSTTR